MNTSRADVRNAAFISSVTLASTAPTIPIIVQRRPTRGILCTQQTFMVGTTPNLCDTQIHIHTQQEVHTQGGTTSFQKVAHHSILTMGSTQA